MKKTLLTLLAILMILSMMAISVAATTDGGSAAVSSTVAKPGQVAYLTVSLSDYPKATSVGISVEGLPVLGAEWQKTGAMQEFVLSKNIGVWASETAVDVNGEFLDLAFNIPESMKDQEEITIKVAVQVLNGSTVLGSETVTGKIGLHVPAESVSLDKTTVELELTTGNTATLIATVKPADHNETLVWTSDNEAVATVKDGVITAYTAGTANITVTAGEVSAVCVVKVTCKHSNLTNIPAKAPTCTAQGNNEYWHCEICGQYLTADKQTVTTVKEQTLDMAAHDYADHWESNEIQHWRICGVCGNKEAAVNHDYQWVIDKEATEDAVGSKHQECACGRKQGGSVEIEKLDHVHVDIKHHEAVAANCCTTGTAEHWTCGSDKCAGKFYADAECKTPLSSITIAIDPDVHTGKTVLDGAVDAGCETDGYSGDTLCDGCRVVLEKGSAISKTGHSYIWVVDKYPSEWNEGVKHEKCSNCGAERSLNTTIGKLDHVHVDIKHHEAVAANCSATGTAEHWTCGSDKCAGKFYADAECKTPLTSITLAIDPAVHTGKTVLEGAVDAGCETDGYSGDTLCDGCRVVLEKGSAISKTGHSYIWVVDKYPSEWNEGVKHEKCSNCGAERSLNTTIGKLIHNPKRVDGKEATCLEDGVIEHFYCANCGRYYAVENGLIGAEIQKEDTILPATGHQLGEDAPWQQDEENHWKECPCGEQTEKEAHTLELTGAVEATDTEEGYTGDEACTVCGYISKQGEVIPCVGIEETTVEVIEDEPAVDDSKNSGGIIAIVAAAIVVCGGGAALVVLKPWKKK